MNKSFNEIAIKIDRACDIKNISSLDVLANEVDALLQNELTDISRAELYFYKANIFAGIRHSSGASNCWTWIQPNLDKEIYSLRLALSFCRFEVIDDVMNDLPSRIETNLANALNHIGRFCEAIEHWDNVLERNPSFGMALLNRSSGLKDYSRALYDGGHKKYFLYVAYQSLKEATNGAIEAHAATPMFDSLESFKKITDWDNIDFSWGKYSLGRSKLERDYREWCLKNRLFVNPLNDLGFHDIAASDVLTFPSITSPAEPREKLIPEVYGIFNQLKQEFISSRYLAYEAITESEKVTHFSDKRVLIYDTLDYRAYALWVEKLKMAFLSAYAIFDKTAYLINIYWELGHSPKNLSFHKIWKTGCNSKQPLSPHFTELNNWPLRGLYWLSKDIFLDNDKTENTEPNARLLYDLRNHMSHKYLKIHHAWSMSRGASQLDNNELFLAISDQEFIGQTVKLLKLVRNSLIYVSLAAHKEEAGKERGDGYIIPAPLFTIGKRD